MPAEETAASGRTGEERFAAFRIDPPSRTWSRLYTTTGVTVTQDYFDVAGHRYAIAELENLRTLRGPYNPLWVSMAALAAALEFAAVLTWGRLGAAGGIALTAAAVVVTGVALALRRARPRPYELWADYRSHTVLLFVTESQAVFGQVARALLRARELQKFTAGGGSSSEHGGGWPPDRSGWQAPPYRG